MNCPGLVSTWNLSALQLFFVEDDTSQTRKIVSERNTVLIFYQALVPRPISFFRIFEPIFRVICSNRNHIITLDRVLVKAHFAVEFGDQVIDLFYLILNVRPIIGFVPLFLNLFIGLALLFDPGVILEVVNSFAGFISCLK